MCSISGLSKKKTSKLSPFSTCKSMRTDHDV